MESDAFIAIITAIIGAAASIVVAQISIKRTMQVKEVEMARMMQAYEDRLTNLESQQKQWTLLGEKLNNIENNVIGVKKDIEYLKERISK